MTLKAMTGSIFQIPFQMLRVPFLLSAAFVDAMFAGLEKQRSHSKTRKHKKEGRK